MKIASLLAGVAALALSATAVSAQSINTFTSGQSSATGSLNFNGSIFTGGAAAAILNGLNANNSSSLVSSWQATGVSVGNIGGNGDVSDGATFSMTGNVSTDCAFYTGSSSNLSFNFGQIGVYVSDNTGPAAAFTMVAPAALNFDTNLAGCNTSNTVSISKNDIRGLVNNSGAGYDSNVFQANLPYIVAATYTAGAINAVVGGVQQTLTVDAASNAAQRSHGAWKSNMDIEVTIPQATQALLAGTYSGNFSVTVAAI
ncbi:MAG: hypothetical protein ACK4I0_09380 [Brevundimonas sp.]|uniref:hypothetical protein n=1 Tax=Brevundimonas sp. TaxID=1871086 RepID=UPI00391CA3CA